MKNRKLLLLNIVIIAVVFILNYFYQKNNFDYTLKILCSSGFSLLAIINTYHAKKDKYIYILTLGILLSMLGDITIKFSFIIGAAVFALGHICFVIAYCMLYRLDIVDISISMIIFILSLLFLLFYPYLTFEIPVFRIVCIIYALIISIMLGKSIGNLIKNNNINNKILFLASTLFFFSDLMLVFAWFVGLYSWCDHACMATYIPALCLYAFSINLYKETS